MVDPDRRPTAQEIEELIDLVRRDPASPAFIDLGEAYLALGRPRDAIQVGNLGLEASPDNLEGRVMLARAHASLHQWKEAQGELLRVVKVDRANRQGFALLGEVLLRRTDFERAVPVLQHAQNLDPTSPQILSMLRRARAGQALDPPAPVPQPIPPRGETDNRLEIQRSRGPASAPPPSQPPRRAPMAPAASPAMPTMAMEPAPAYMPQPSAAPPPPMQRGPKQTAPPPMSVEGVKPRIVQSAKPQNAAAHALRQSAAVGENYLNELLTGGLLDVAGVRVPEADYDLRPDRRWGRSTRRAFIFLFVILVLGIGGTTTWYVWAEKEKADAVAELRSGAIKDIGAGDYPSFVDAVGKLEEAGHKDKSNKHTGATFVYAGGLAVLLYGEVHIPNKDDATKELVVDASGVDNAYTQFAKGEDPIQPTDEGYREMTIGKVALDLSRMPSGLAPSEVIKAGVEKLADINKTLDDLLTKDTNDKWARWLKGRAALAAGDRRGAAMAFKAAADGDDGVVVARIDQANLLADDGKTEEALGLYKRVLDNPAAKNHTLAVLGENLAKAEAQIDLDKVIDDLAAKLGATEKLPSRLAAYRWLALATVRIAVDDYKGAAEALTKAYLNKAMSCGSSGGCQQHPISEPRFWARIAWVHYKLGRPKSSTLPKGDLEGASNARKNALYLSKTQDDPTVKLVDAGLLLATGLPEKVIDIAAKLDGVRPKILQVYALIDLSKPKEALAVAEEVLKAGGEANTQPCARDTGKLKRMFEAKSLCELALMMSNEKERGKASDSLSSLASGNENQIPRHLLGVGHLQFKDSPPFVPDTGSNLEYAKKSLKKAVDDISDEHPNPLVYRTLTSLAEIALIEKDIALAGKTLDLALDANQGYFPTLGLQARIVLRNGEPDKALDLLAPILNESAAITPIIQLTLAEALATHKKNVQPKDKEQAEALLTELKGKPGITDEEIGRVAALIDAKLPEKLGVPAPDASGEPKKPPKTGRPRHK